MNDAIDAAVRDLEAAWPPWQIWVVRHAVGNQHGSRTTFGARRWNGSGDVLNANTADELAQLLARQEWIS